KEKRIEAGFDNCLTKPVKMRRLLSKLSQFLKHTKIAEPSDRDPAFDNAPKKLSMEDLEKLPELLEKIEEEVLPFLKKIKAVMKVGDIRKFEAIVRGLGEDYQVEGLVDYADKLKKYVQSFDIGKLEKCLTRFFDMFEELTQLRERG
ncbi:MAG: hypothetical protein GY859_33605, partial [Desulfobacterales bacterium]|nr:hypothetical protein [Desulfobacterales bacterium]